MKSLKNRYPICMGSSNALKVILFLIALSTSTAFAQGVTSSTQTSTTSTQSLTALAQSSTSSYSMSEYMEENETPDETEYVSDTFGGAQTRSWIVAQNKFFLWTIWALDTVNGDIFTGIQAANISVIREGALLIGDLVVTGKTGYGVWQASSEVSVSIACEIRITAWAGTPPFGSGYFRSHTHRL
ncbi:hypothetical protein [Mucilaginibacter sp. UYCu711]|uniref:hypothetical protein n=1 Tax=Mucilaginibacter sp. UYCu711 TaxID=3156339 RepID=UPI003D1A74C5